MARYGRTLILAALVLAAGSGEWQRLWAENGLHKHYLHEAHAFLHGRLDIDEAFGDVATYNGKHYVVFPPFPALLITPLVAVLGDEARTTVVSVALTVLNFFLLRGILRKLEVERELERWLLAAFFLGTAYATSLFQAYESWHFAHIVAVTCLLLALYEAFGKGRGVLVGFACGLAFLSRHLCIFAAVFLAVVVWQRRREASRRARVVQLAALALPLAACIGAYLWLNWVRFGNPLDAGYEYMPLEGFLDERVQTYGLFHIAYLPFNFVYMFLQGFHIDFAPPRLLSVQGMDPFGTSITFASPFVFFALWARPKRPLLWTAWAAIALPILCTALYYNNGFAQANAQRFTLDFMPILIILVALGARRIEPHWGKAAIGYAVALNFTALFVVSILRRLSVFP